MEHISLDSSSKAIDKLSFEDHQKWIDNVLLLNRQSAIFYFIHITSFLNKYSSTLGITRLVYMEKQFFYALDLKLLDWAAKLLNNFIGIFGDDQEAKIRRMKADFIQIQQKEIETDNISPLEEAMKTYKAMFKENQHDKNSIKSYLSLLKANTDASGIGILIDYYNEYLKVYMDDIEVWNELGDIYISMLNYNKAIFCLEEVLLHFPNNYLVYIKIGDLLSSFNNTEAASQALKYYSKSILIKPTPRAFWGIIHIANVFNKYKKELDDNLKKSVKIATENLKTYYPEKYLEEILSMK